MDLSHEQDDFQPEIQAFLTWMERSCSFEVINPDEPSPVTLRFMCLDKIQHHLEENGQRRLKDLIIALFRNDDYIWPDDVLPQRIAVFCILLQISRGRFMKHFRHHDTLGDDKLPFNPESPPTNWPQTTGDPDFLRNFCAQQWKFCVPVLRQPFLDRYFEEDRILPIVFKKTLNTQGSSAVLWLIKLHPTYNKLLKDTRKSELGDSANTFVLKTYFTKDAQKYYTNEVSAFRHIGPNPSIIGFHGSFTRGNTFNVLLEYADKGTLEEYFRTQLPPTDGEDIIQFWEALFKTIDALRRIHEIGSSEPDGLVGPRVLRGWHQDIKPANVLIVSNGLDNYLKWQFKLADLGISHFKMKLTSREDSTASDSHGTRTYGAPECYRPDDVSVRSKLKVGQNVDIWSLGCIFSEAARWMKHQYHGIELYRQERLAETSEIPDFRDAECFHNGDSALKAVRKSHDISTKSLRTEDFITKAVVDKMISEMLYRAEARPTASQLWHKSVMIVAEARQELERTNNPQIREKSILRSQDSGYPQPGRAPPPPPITPHNFQVAFSYDAKGNGTRPNIDWGQTGSSPTTHILDIENEPRSDSPISMTDTGNGQELDTGILNGGQAINGNQEGAMGISPVLANGETVRGAETLSSGRARHMRRHSGRQGVPQTPTRGGHLIQISESSVNPKRKLSGMHEMPAEGTISQVNSPATSPEVSNPSGASWDRPRAFDTALDGTKEGFHSDFLNQNGANDTSRTNHRRYDSKYSTTAPPDTVSDEKLQSMSGHIQEDQQAGRQQVHSSKPKQRSKVTIVQFPPPPRLSLEDSLEWKRERKTGNRKRISNYEYQDRLVGRDHAFLIDDSFTMRPHWKSVLRIFEALSYIVKETDPNGIDLYFTVSLNSRQNCKPTTKLLQMVRTRPLHGSTDINLRLATILNNYKAALARPPSLLHSKPVRPLTLYILTDGVWESECNPEPLIRNLVQKLVDLEQDKKQVGVQFISFGDNPVGLRRMDHLDSGLKLKMDIVDTEPSDGNVWKMLLGSINESFDRVNETPPTSSTSSEERGISSSLKSS